MAARCIVNEVKRLITRTIWEALLASSLHKLMNVLYVKYPRQSGKSTKHRCVFGLVKKESRKNWLFGLHPLLAVVGARLWVIGRLLVWRENFLERLSNCKSQCSINHNRALPQKCVNWLSWFIINLVFSSKNILLLA